jgi:aspartate/methionine/tyrosine aminotransferase
VNEGRTLRSEYMYWAKTAAGGRYNLANSGVTNYPLSSLPVEIDDLELSGHSYYGYEPLQRALAAKTGVSTDRIVAANGTSMANFLAMAVLLEPGDEVLIEHPTYELLLSTAGYLGARVKRFRRPRAAGFRVDVAAIAAALTPRTRLMVLTNLNNPSGALIDVETLRQVGKLAESVGARVLVDEVYLDALFENTPPSAATLGDRFITTASLTKAYGLSGLRCGWVLAAPDLALKMWRLSDLIAPVPAHVAELLSCVALADLPVIAERARGIVESNRATLNAFLASRPDLEESGPAYGTVSFPRLLSGNVDDLCGLLREKYETTVVPGLFFDVPDHFRIGLGALPDVFQAGLARLGKALDDLRARNSDSVA